MSKIKVQGKEITILPHNEQDYISLTDMINGDKDGSLIEKWLSNKNTIEFLGIWEQINNPDFNSPEFGGIKDQAGVNRFYLSVKQWIEKTGAIGLIAKAGRYGGTYAHKDIAFEFGAWLSPMFKLYLIKEFQRLKDEEHKAQHLDWDYSRFLSKVNYRIHTDAVKDGIIPMRGPLSKSETGYVYASEAEIINMAVFGITAKQWRLDNPQDVLKGYNMRDMATIPQLTVLANIESYNSILIQQGMAAKERLELLKSAATQQLKALSNQKYSYSIDSPNAVKNTSSTFDNTLKGMLSVPPPKNEKKDE